MKKIKPLKNPLYVASPILPKLSEVNSKLKEIWDVKWLTNNGNQHQLLEKKLKKILKVDNLSLFNNGTIALMLALKVLKIKGEVITTPFTFAATPNSILWNNLKPVFCDIDPVTMNIDADKIESLITPKTTAILAVHVFGMPCDVVKIQEIADKHNLKVIYDAAHAFEVEIDGKPIASFGDITMFSFHATKLFHTVEGGALVSQSEQIKSEIDLLKNFGIKNEEEVVLNGMNGKMNEVQAAMGLLVADYREEEKKYRKKLGEIYRKNLKDIEGITLMDIPKNVKQGYQYFIIRVDEAKFGKSRDYLYEKFKKYNIFVRKYFYPLCSNYEYFSHLPSSKPSKLPIANTIVKQTLSLPYHGRVKLSEAQIICDLIKQFQKD